MQNIFTVKQSNNNLRSDAVLVNYKSTFGVNTFDFRAAMAWANLPANIKCQIM